MKSNGLSKNGYRLISAAAILLTFIVVAAGITAAVKKELASRPQFIKVAKDESLRIPYSEIDYGISFFPVKYDGVNMGIITYRDRSGVIMAALDACKTCDGKKNSYFEYDRETDSLICQNTGTGFNASRVGQDSDYGCVPYPITELDRFDTYDTLVIAGGIFDDTRDLFEKWDKYSR